MNNRLSVFFLWVALYLMANPVYASPQRVYQQAMQEAAQGKLSQAQTRLQTALQLLPVQSAWVSRMQAAHALLHMRQTSALTWQVLPPMQQNLALVYVATQATPEASPEWLVGGLATFLPGSGHAYLGLWRDALSACLLVIPMLILTLWAARRRMGPVTVFFALISMWLWSGTVFSAVSLAQRGSQEAYMLWWQGLWQAAALTGQPW